MKTARRTIAQMQADAEACAKRLFLSIPLHINPALSDGDRDETYRKVMQGYATAWAEGYTARADENSR